jgi:hypothetical protein
MTKESNFENIVPGGIRNLQNALLDMGVCAHTGLSGKSYREGEVVGSGTLVRAGEDEESKDARNLRYAKHQHLSSPRYIKDGVPVVTKFLTPEENEALNDP